jgi:hypothetical protein
MKDAGSSCQIEEREQASGGGESGNLLNVIHGLEKYLKDHIEKENLTIRISNQCGNAEAGNVAGERWACYYGTLKQMELLQLKCGVRSVRKHGDTIHMGQDGAFDLTQDEVKTMQEGGYVKKDAEEPI